MLIIHTVLVLTAHLLHVHLYFFPGTLATSSGSYSAPIGDDKRQSLGRVERGEAGGGRERGGRERGGGGREEGGGGGGGGREGGGGGGGGGGERGGAADGGVKRGGESSPSLHPALSLMIQSMPSDLAKQLVASTCSSACACCWLIVYRTFELNTVCMLLKDCM